MHGVQPFKRWPELGQTKTPRLQARTPPGQRRPPRVHRWRPRTRNEQSAHSTRAVRALHASAPRPQESVGHRLPRPAAKQRWRTGRVTRTRAGLESNRRVRVHQSGQTEGRGDRRKARSNPRFALGASLRKSGGSIPGTPGVMDVPLSSHQIAGRADDGAADSMDVLVCACVAVC
jgi:hypothetical protein